MDDTARDRIRRSFAAQSMMTTLWARDSSRSSARAWSASRRPILPGAMQQQGFGHAGLTFSIGDSAAGYAALTMLPLDIEVVTARSR